jgi:hypothetical protein
MGQEHREHPHSSSCRGSRFEPYIGRQTTIVINVSGGRYAEQSQRERITLRIPASMAYAPQSTNKLNYTPNQIKNKLLSIPRGNEISLNISPLA